ncbi:MAG: hypothetical protein AB8C02_06080 [Halioglobus sp.]
MLVATLVGLTTLAAFALVIIRGGLIPWSTFVIGIGLIAKSVLKSHNTSLRAGIAFTVISLLVWLGTYYDAPPEIAQRLLAGTPLQLLHNGKLTTRKPNATHADNLPRKEFNHPVAYLTSSPSLTEQ